MPAEGESLAADMAAGNALGPGPLMAGRLSGGMGRGVCRMLEVGGPIVADVTGIMRAEAVGCCWQLWLGAVELRRLFRKAASLLC